MTDPRIIENLKELYSKQGYILIGADGPVPIGQVLDAERFIYDPFQIAKEARWRVLSEGTPDDMKAQMRATGASHVSIHPRYCFFYRVEAAD